MGLIYEDGKLSYLINLMFPIEFTTTERYQTKEIIELLLPGIVFKVFTGSSSIIEAIISSETIELTEDKTYIIDHKLEQMLNEVSIFIEESFQHCSINRRITEIFKSYIPIKATILDGYGRGVQIRCQLSEIPE